MRGEIIPAANLRAQIVDLRYAPPPAALVDHIAFLYVARTGPAAYEEVLPALLPQIIVCLGGEADAEIGETACRLPPIAIIGATHGVTRLRGRDGHAMLGAGILPRGWASLTRAGADLAADQVLDGGHFLGAALPLLHESILEAGDDSARLALLIAYLVERFSDPAAVASAVAAVDAWVTGSSSLATDELAGTLELSPRSLRRLTARTHGSSPYLLAAKYRALRAAARLTFEPSADWMDAAGDHYFDQPHFIREFRRFLGATPGVWRRDRAMLQQLIMRQRRAAGVRHPLALLS